jgi:hypothetical protein
MVRGLPDICILMLVGSVPDYVQGIIKLVWAIGARPAGRHLSQPSYTS